MSSIPGRSTALPFAFVRFGHHFRAHYFIPHCIANCYLVQVIYIYRNWPWCRHGSIFVERHHFSTNSGLYRYSHQSASSIRFHITLEILVSTAMAAPLFASPDYLNVTDPTTPVVSSTILPSLPSFIRLYYFVRMYQVNSSAYQFHCLWDRNIRPSSNPYLVYSQWRGGLSRVPVVSGKLYL